MHVPTGLFVQGHYMAADYNDARPRRQRLLGLRRRTRPRRTPTHWLIQAGIAKNWFGIGNTALYGEYGKATIGVLRLAGRNFAGSSAFATPFTGDGYARTSRLSTA